MGALKGRGLPSRLGKGRSRLHRDRPEKVQSPHHRSNRPINTAAWQRARAAFIKQKWDEAIERGDVLRCCKTDVPLIGKHPAPDSPVVDHIKADRGDLKLFWDRTNWQVVSKAWHDKVKQSREKRGIE